MSQFSVQPLVQLLDQARTGNKPWSSAGNIELGGQERGGHKLIITTNFYDLPAKDGLENCLLTFDNASYHPTFRDVGNYAEFRVLIFLETIWWTGNRI